MIDFDLHFNPNEIDAMLDVAKNGGGEVLHGVVSAAHTFDGVWLRGECDPAKYDTRLKVFTGLVKLDYRGKGKKPKRKVQPGLEYIDKIKAVHFEARKEGYSYGYAVYFHGIPSPVRFYFKHSKHKIRGENYYLGIRINPSGHALNTIKLIRRFISEKLGKDLLDALPGFKVTRVDVAVDIAGVQVADFYYLFMAKQKARIYLDRNQNIQTLYYGEMDDGLCVYDKLAEINANPNKNDCYELGEELKRIVPKCEMTRFEIRYKPRSMTLKDLVDAKYWPDFSKIECYKVDGSLKLDHKFVLASKFVGLQPLLKLESESDRRRIKKVLQQSKVTLPFSTDKEACFEESGVLLRYLISTSKKERKAIQELFSGKKADYVHEGVITPQLLKLATGIMSELTLEQKQQLRLPKKWGDDLSELIGCPINKAGALKLIELGGENG
jgi:hypothetical protein